jgi:uncharacterized protein (UPF0147 family)
LDASAIGRAESAFQHEFAKWQSLIDAVASDRSLPQDRRQAAVAALRARQRAAANAAKRRVMEEEKQKTRSARRAALLRLKPAR